MNFLRTKLEPGVSEGSRWNMCDLALRARLHGEIARCKEKYTGLSVLVLWPYGALDPELAVPHLLALVQREVRWDDTAMRDERDVVLFCRGLDARGARALAARIERKTPYRLGVGLACLPDAWARSGRDLIEEARVASRHLWPASAAAGFPASPVAAGAAPASSDASQ